MLLYDNAFSPFARKVRLVLEAKSLEATTVDGLDKRNHEALHAVNGRVEVPVLVDDDVVVVNSADIVAYLDHRFTEKPMLPSDPALRVKARKWERVADTLVDPILTNISYWSWMNRSDEQPEGMLSAASEDLESVYLGLEADLTGESYICGALSIADISLFPHLVATAQLGVPPSKERHPKLIAWLRSLKRETLFLNDLKRTRDFLSNLNAATVETEKIFWRGERIEWLLAHGFQDWFFNEIQSGRAIFPSQKLR